MSSQLPLEQEIVHGSPDSSQRCDAIVQNSSEAPQCRESVVRDSEILVEYGVSTARSEIEAPSAPSVACASLAEAEGWIAPCVRAAVRENNEELLQSLVRELDNAKTSICSRVETLLQQIQLVSPGPLHRAPPLVRNAPPLPALAIVPPPKLRDTPQAPVAAAPEVVIVQTDEGASKSEVLADREKISRQPSKGEVNGEAQVHPDPDPASWSDSGFTGSSSGSSKGTPRHENADSKGVPGFAFENHGDKSSAAKAGPNGSAVHMGHDPVESFQLLPHSLCSTARNTAELVASPPTGQKSHHSTSRRRDSRDSAKSTKSTKSYLREKMNDDKFTKSLNYASDIEEYKKERNKAKTAPDFCSWSLKGSVAKPANKGGRDDTDCTDRSDFAAVLPSEEEVSLHDSLSNGSDKYVKDVFCEIDVHPRRLSHQETKLSLYSGAIAHEMSLNVNYYSDNEDMPRWRLWWETLKFKYAVWSARISMLSPCLCMSNASEKIRFLVETSEFDYVISAFIVLNAITIGVQADYNVQNIEADTPSEYRYFELIFCFVFTLELVLRIFAYGSNFLFSEEWRWNLFDSLVVMMQVVEEVLAFYYKFVSGEQGKHLLAANFNFVRILRILRLVRIVRIVRLLRFMQELRAMVLSIASSFRSLCWTLVLLMLLMYVIGVGITQFVADAALERSLEADEDVLREEGEKTPLGNYFGSLSRTVLSLYQAMTGGVDWNDLNEPLAEKVSPVMSVVLALYIAFAVFAMTNVVTGVFVESALATAKEDREAEVRDQVRRLFALSDTDNDGCITWEEFTLSLAKPNMDKHFSALDIDVEEARGLFLLIDSDESGTIDLEEFIGGCLRLRGAAKAVDLATLMYFNRRSYAWMVQRQENMEKGIEVILSIIVDLERTVEDFAEIALEAIPGPSPNGANGIHPVAKDDLGLPASTQQFETPENRRFSAPVAAANWGRTSTESAQSPKKLSLRTWTGSSQSNRRITQYQATMQEFHEKQNTEKIYSSWGELKAVAHLAADATAMKVAAKKRVSIEEDDPDDQAQNKSFKELLHNVDGDDIARVRKYVSGGDVSPKRKGTQDDKRKSVARKSIIMSATKSLPPLALQDDARSANDRRKSMHGAIQRVSDKVFRSGSAPESQRKEPNSP